MRPTFLGLEIGKRAVAVSQKGLDITGHNLSNATTPGYTRQRVDQVSVASSTYSMRYGNTAGRIMLAGQGSDIRGVSQTRDVFLDKRFREEFGEVGYYSKTAEIYSDIESALDEIKGDSGLNSALSTIAKALQEYGNNPDSTTHANIVSSSFKNISQLLHEFDRKLDNIATQQHSEVDLAVDEINLAFEKIAALNRSISEAMNSTGGREFAPNELIDERNLILDELSRYGDFGAEQMPDGTVTVTFGGKEAVVGSKIERLQYQKNQNGTAVISWSSTGQSLKLTTGVLKGSLDMINGRGPNAQSSSEEVTKGILYFKDKLNTFARTLVQVVNNSIPELKEVVDADGNKTYVPATDNYGQIIYKELMGARSEDPDNPGQYMVNDNSIVTAANISLSDKWESDPSHMIFQEGSKLNTYSTNLYTKLVGEGSGSGITFTAPGEEFKGTFNEFVLDYNGYLFSQTAYYDERSEATATIADDLIDRRDSVSGINQEEETTNMMVYQKSFQAASRLINTLDEMLDIIINNMGLVGR